MERFSPLQAWQTKCYRTDNERLIMKTKFSLSAAKRRMVAAFSLVETTVGMSILGTVAAALMTGVTTGFFTMQLARENLRATQIMLEKVETIRLYTWDQITDTNHF